MSKFFGRSKFLKNLINVKERNVKERLEHTGAAGKLNIPPLDQPLEGYEHLNYIDPQSIAPFSTKLSTLKNGLRVATEQNFGQYCTVGVAIDAGSRYETFYPQGTSHFIEKLAFSPSMMYPDPEVAKSILEKCGALVDCQAAKDTFLYASSCRVENVKQILHYMADTIFRPLLEQNFIAETVPVIEYENLFLERTPECEPLLTDWIHQAAFRGNTVGLSKFCTNENAKLINRSHLFSYLSQYFTPDRIVLAGVGVDHDLLKEAGEVLFNTENTIWAQNQDLLLKEKLPKDESLAQYTGGELRIERDLSNMAQGPTLYRNLAHLVIGLEGVSVSDPDFIAFCVLQSLLGGGGSFSAGGPGKGMFTRLYLNVLHKYNWMDNATAFNHSYSDTGLFCIRVSADPKFMSKLPQIIKNEFLLLTKGIHKVELERAKIQLKSQLMLNLEMRPVRFEDMARQVLAHGFRKKPQEYMEQIDNIQSYDIERITHKMLSSKPAVVGYGDLKNLPEYEKIIF